MKFQYHINPRHDSGEDTLCMALRRMWLQGEATGNKAVMDDAAKAFDFAKRMDRRLKYYRDKYEPDRVGPETQRGHPESGD